MLISIITPVFNSKNFLKQCTDSILKLKYKNFELILIDDGSTDGSSKMCDNCAKLDDRVIVIHQNNLGQAAARNRGLKIAKGKYILFCDSDDFYNTSDLDCVLSNIALNNDIYDLYAFNFCNLWNNSVDYNQKYKSSTYTVNTREELISNLSTSMIHKAIGYSIWNKVYSNDIIQNNNITFFERSELNNKDDWAEDLFFNLKYLAYTKKIKVYGYCAYVLRKHGDKVVQNDNALLNRLDHMLVSFLHLNNFFEENEIWKIVIWHMKRYLYVDANIYGVKNMRNIYLKAKYWKDIMEYVCVACNEWSTYAKSRWGEYESKDYKYLLLYLKNGRYINYKFYNYALWNFKNKLKRKAIK